MAIALALGVQLVQLALVLVLAPLLTGLVRRLKAHLVGRQGPPLLQPYRELLRLRRETPALRSLDLSAIDTHADDEHRILAVRRRADGDQVLVAFNFGEKARTIDLPFAEAEWRALIDTGAKIEGGRLTLPPTSFALFGA